MEPDIKFWRRKKFNCLLSAVLHLRTEWNLSYQAFSFSFFKVKSHHYCRVPVASCFTMQCLFLYNPLSILLLYCKPIKCIQSLPCIFRQHSALPPTVLFQKTHRQNGHRGQERWRTASHYHEQKYIKYCIHTCTTCTNLLYFRRTFLGGQLEHFVLATANK